LFVVRLAGMPKKPLKADFHLHTRSDPFDDIPYSSEELIDEMAKRGYEVLAITNHDCQSYCARLYDYARERGVLLIRGMELGCDGQHIVLLNFDDPSDISTPEDILRKKRPDNLVLAAHPYFPWAPGCGRLLDAMPEMFDAVEYAHLYNHWINFNRKAVARAGELGLPMLGTSDAHTLSQIGYTYTHVYSEKKTPEAVIAAIKAGRAEVVTRPFPFTRFLGVIAMMRWQDVKRWAGKLGSN